MAVIQLERRFAELNDKQPLDPEVSIAHGAFGWEELLQRRRVVVLAEAGSGKTTEMKERVRLSALTGRCSFYATVEDVGREGLDKALRSRDSVRLARWLESDEMAWFFVDCVDQAKASGVRLQKVVERIADGIIGSEARSHIILSGRITDWEFRRDLESVSTALRIPEEHPQQRQTKPEEELLRIVRHQSPPDDPPSPEQPLVVTMRPLDRTRIRRFAEASDIPNVEEFLAQVSAANLWHLARRPLDLSWLIQFWRTENRLGSLSDMIQLSIIQRLAEANEDRSRTDTLDRESALHAAELIGAAMVFGRTATIAIPDGELAFSSESPIDLANVLPDWSPNERTLLLSRAIFDPATLGKVRLHNDNEGVVRGYLAARWLKRLRSENLPTSTLFDLLFARSYGLNVVKPSLCEMASWLVLWDRDVAREVTRRSPLLLLTSGDPSSVHFEVRRDALLNLIEELRSPGRELPWIRNDQLRRFSQPDMGSLINEIWPSHRTHPEIAQLLLKIVWLGELRDCAELASDATFEPNPDTRTRIFAAKALLFIGTEENKRRYAELIKTQSPTLPGAMINDAIAAMFPHLIGIHDLLSILKAIDPKAEHHAEFSFDREGPLLVTKLNSPSDIETLLSGLLDQLGSGLGEHGHEPPSKREEEYFPAIAKAASRLLMLSPAECAPHAATDAVLLIGNRLSGDRELQLELDRAQSELHRTSARRRTAFWRMVNRLSPANADCRRVNHLWEMKILGYSPGLQAEDIEWLLSDAVTNEESDRRLAINAALEVQQGLGTTGGWLVQIELVARKDECTSAIFDDWLQPRPPAPGLNDRRRELREIQRQNEEELTNRDQSWIDFVGKLQCDPGRIAKLRSSDPPQINPDLRDLWHLLTKARWGSRRVSKGLAPLETIVGREVTEAARVGFMKHWRNWPPCLRSQRSPTERGLIWELDGIGIEGVAIEAEASDGWAQRITSTEATLAAGYATLKANGFPSWLQPLSMAKPQEVREVLIGEILDELSHPELNHSNALQNISHSGRDIAALVAPALVEALVVKQMHYPQPTLLRLLSIIVNGIQSAGVGQFVILGLAQFKNESDVGTAVSYLASVFSLDPNGATLALAEKLDDLGDNDQRAYVNQFLTLVIGDTASFAFRTADMKASTLEQLVQISLRTSSKNALRRRATGIVYTLDDQDYADHARSNLFNRFADTPGAATFSALLRLRDNPNNPLTPAQLQTLLEERASQDSESAPWPADEAFAFEQTHQVAPRTGKDLQALVLRRLEDMQHDLVHGDFAQAATLRGLALEVEIQNWVADRLRLLQGRSYSLEREPHVVDEKEPDMRFRAKNTDVSVAMEIKLTKSWTVKQLEAALEDQLCGQYLRANDGRYGILLLVHQGIRCWRDPQNGSSLSFQQVIARLNKIAERIAGTSYKSPQPQVCVLDVSSASRR